MAVSTFAAKSPTASPGGCIHTAPPGRTNTAFGFRVDNLLPDRQAPAPDIIFGVNLTPTGDRVDPSITTLDNAYTHIEVTPASGGICLLAGGIGGTNNPAIPAGGNVIFTGIIGPLPDPLPTGMVLLIRIFPANPDGTSTHTQDFSIPFPPT